MVDLQSQFLPQDTPLTDFFVDLIKPSGWAIEEAVVLMKISDLAAMNRCANKSLSPLKAAILFGFVDLFFHVQKFTIFVRLIGFSNLL